MTKLTKELWAAFLVVSAATGPAFAQPPDQAAEPMPSQQGAQPQPQPYPGAAPQEAEYGARRGMERVGFSLSLGGGVEDFTHSAMRDTTGFGGSWALRATVGTKTPFGFEGSYFGSAQSISALGLDPRAKLVSNGLQGALRLNAAIGAPVTPFLFGGVAWAHYNVTHAARSTADIANKDNVLEIPVGLGVGGSYRGFGWDLRGELRFASSNNLVPEYSAGRFTGNYADMTRWGVNATVGYGF